VALLVGGTAFLRTALGRRHPLSGVLERVLIWWSAIGVLLLAGGLVNGDARVVNWGVAVVLVYVVIWLGFPVPGLGRTQTRDYTIRGEHLAERCQLFIILALGESILITGANLGELPISIETVAAFVAAFIGSVTLWWIYFDRGAEAGLQVMSATTDPGRLGLSAFTYFHIPMVAGIILAAAADELTLAHPTEPVSAVTACVILGAPLLYLVGNILYKQALWGHVPRSRYVAILSLGVLILLSPVSSALVLLAGVTAVLIGVAWWDMRTLRLASKS
jgi:low temperature requirement protein LtrA